MKELEKKAVVCPSCESTKIKQCGGGYRCAQCGCPVEVKHVTHALVDTPKRPKIDMWWLARHY